MQPPPKFYVQLELCVVTYPNPPFSIVCTPPLAFPHTVLAMPLLFAGSQVPGTLY
jgi:hypothetical protein